MLPVFRLLSLFSSSMQACSLANGRLCSSTWVGWHGLSVSPFRWLCWVCAAYALPMRWIIRRNHGLCRLCGGRSMRGRIVKWRAWEPLAGHGGGVVRCQQVNDPLAGLVALWLCHG